MRYFIEKRRWAFIPETLYPPRMGLEGLCPYHYKNTNGAFMPAWNNSWKAVENGKACSGIVFGVNVEMCRRNWMDFQTIQVWRPELLTASIVFDQEVVNKYNPKKSCSAICQQHL